jgi:hypothetical protein
MQSGRRLQEGAPVIENAVIAAGLGQPPGNFTADEIVAWAIARMGTTVGIDAGAARTGEVGVTDPRYPVGDVRRYGAIPNSSAAAAANVTAFNNAAVSAGVGGRVYVPAGQWWLNGTVTLLDLQTLAGDTFQFGVGGAPATQVKWTGIAGSTVGVQAGVNCTFRRLLFRGVGATGNTAVGVSSNSAGHPFFESCGFYSWNTGVALTAAFYAQFHGRCEFAYNFYATKLTGCYNVHHFGTVFRGSQAIQHQTAVNVTDTVRHLALFGGSIEGFDSTGAILLGAGSLLDVLGVYFESSVAGSNAFGIICNGGSATVNLLGNQVYLSEANRWFAGNGQDKIQLTSRGNKFVCAVGSSTNPIAYVMPTNGTGGSIDVSGDDWTNVDKATAIYTSVLNAGAVKNVWIVPPTGLGTSAVIAEHHYLGRPIVLPTLTAPPSSPIAGAIYVADRVTWDPAAKGAGNRYPVFYDGGAYKALY